MCIHKESVTAKVTCAICLFSCLYNLYILISGSPSLFLALNIVVCACIGTLCVVRVPNERAVLAVSFGSLGLFQVYSVLRGDTELVAAVASLLIIIGYALVAAYFLNAFYNRMGAILAAIAVFAGVFFMYSVYPLYIFHLSLQANSIHTPIKLNVNLVNLYIEGLKNIEQTMSLVCYCVPSIVAVLLVFSTTPNKTGGGAPKV